MIGKGYIVDHCIALFNKKEEERQYRIYVTDLLMGLFNRLSPSGSEPLTVRYADCLEYAKPKKKEKSGDEIAAEIIKKWNLKPKGKNDE